MFDEFGSLSMQMSYRQQKHEQEDLAVEPRPGLFLINFEFIPNHATVKAK